MPSLSWNLPPPFIIAKDPERGMVYLGGLGALGVGEMWYPATEMHLNDPAWEHAPIRSSVGGLRVVIPDPQAGEIG